MIWRLRPGATTSPTRLTPVECAIAGFEAWAVVVHSVGGELTIRSKNTRSVFHWLGTIVFISSLLLIPSHLTSGQGGDDVYTYVSDYWRHAVIVIKNFQIVDDISLSADSISSVDITPDGSRLYATNNGGMSISMIVVDPESPN